MQAISVELSPAVQTIVGRMQSNPEEFFGEALKWAYIFKERFREILTETEKGAVFDALKIVRRMELGHLVMTSMLPELTEAEEKAQMKYATKDRYKTSGFGQAQIKKQGSKVGY